MIAFAFVVVSCIVQIALHSNNMSLGCLIQLVLLYILAVVVVPVYCNDNTDDPLSNLDKLIALVVSTIIYPIYIDSRLSPNEPIMFWHLGKKKIHQQRASIEYIFNQHIPPFFCRAYRMKEESF